MGNPKGLAPGVLYRTVIDDVISDIRSEFESRGLTHLVDRFRELWEHQLQESGAVDDAEQTQLQYSKYLMQLQMDTVQDVQLENEGSSSVHPAVEVGRPLPFLPPQPKSLTVAAAGFGDDDALDGAPAHDEPSAKRQKTAVSLGASAPKSLPVFSSMSFPTSSQPPKKEGPSQVDGATEIAGKLIGDSASGRHESDSEELSEDDDDIDTENIILGTYAKVSKPRTSRRSIITMWKCHMRGAVMTIDGKDHVFYDAIGTFEF